MPYIDIRELLTEKDKNGSENFHNFYFMKVSTDAHLEKHALVCLSCLGAPMHIYRKMAHKL